MAENNTINENFPLAFNNYATFDATSLKSLMQQRLIEGEVFTDQIFEGSNFNSLLDIIAYSYHILLFYLNRTANEASFSTAQLYENVNKIVKILNYNPVGIQTSILSLSASAYENLPIGIYTIPRYSYFSVNDIKYSFIEDVTFTKSVSGVEVLNELNDSTLLYQGEFVQYNPYIATGEIFEEFNIVSVDSEGNNDLIDHNNIHVFVKGDYGNGVWKEYKQVNSLYLQSKLSESFELRLNENQRYTVKFGNNITGKGLNKGDIVVVYYLKSNGVDGEFGPNVINGSRLFTYNSEIYSEIMNDIREYNTNIISLDESLQLNFINTLPSSEFSYQESSTSIKNNSRNTYKSQYRLVNALDFENYIMNNFSNLISDVKAIDNNTFIEEHLNYYNKIGISEPNLDSRILFNQINFSSSCGFNNINIYCVPKIPQNENSNYNKFLNLGLKNKIKDSLNSIKVITSDIVFQDPIYMSIGLGLSTPYERDDKKLYPEIINETKLIIKKRTDSFFNNSTIIENILNIFFDYFKINTLGKTIDVDYLNSSISIVKGVDTFYCERNVNGDTITSNGLSFMLYNPVYYYPNEDISIINQTIKLPFFKTCYYDNYTTLKSNIIVQ